MYYGILSAAVIIFGLQFFCNDKYQAVRGTSRRAAVELIFGGSLVGALVLFAISGFTVSLTAYTLMMAVITAVIFIVMIYSSTIALGKTSLSIYSMFSQLGGMLLPFVAGILIYGEPMTLGKGVCIAAVLVSVLLTVRPGEKKGGMGYCLVIFFTNGILSIVAKMYEEAQVPKASAIDYSVWAALSAAIFTGIMLLFMKEDRRRPSVKPVLLMGGYGALNKVGNYFLLISLAHIPVSVQYPMVTGGVIVVSTLLSYFTPKKPGARDYLSLVFALLGIGALVLV